SGLTNLDDPPRRRNDRLQQIRVIADWGLRIADRLGHAEAPEANSSAVEMPMSRSSVRLASPRSIARDAFRIPSSTDNAAPAMNSAAPAFSSTTSRAGP